MHIPDGYLSPSTCGILVGAATPFLVCGLRRVQKTLTTRMVPLLSVFAAFSFVIMMFNLPLPGGTTGHAVGMGVASIVLGPWASMLAISIALVIQAVFFGDGGITAIGANCFNMAIVGSLASYAIYRLLGFRATLGSARRVLAAGIGGYVAINIAAFCAAIEFGIQPILFRDASGAPLYAPYPLSVSIPAMMIGHLTLAGLAEFIISAGIIAYLQRTDLGLLRLSAPDAPDHDDALPTAPEALTLPAARKLWLGLALLLILTPLGILAVGSAWGEWTARGTIEPASETTNCGGFRRSTAAGSRPTRVGTAVGHLDGAALAICSGVHPQPIVWLLRVRHGGSRADSCNLRSGNLATQQGPIHAAAVPGMGSIQSPQAQELCRENHTQSAGSHAAYSVRGGHGGGGRPLAAF